MQTTDIATAGVGGAGVVATAVPFVQSFAPSERARALGAPVSASIAVADSVIEIGVDPS